MKTPVVYHVEVWLLAVQAGSVSNQTCLSEGNQIKRRLLSFGPGLSLLRRLQNSFIYN